jgi:hypothetical protein
LRDTGSGRMDSPDLPIPVRRCMVCPSCSFATACFFCRTSNGEAIYRCVYRSCHTMHVRAMPAPMTQSERKVRVRGRAALIQALVGAR